ncbi:MAG TPA: TadE/TadG family type IV pilus assembly protein [Actinomycetota bacterium]|nr:TadE/TadG family type IV pilus assembly protein [Actinomycetota bacterium]
MIRRRLDQLRADQQGAVAVIVGLLMVVLLGSAATVMDLARLRHERHMIQAAVDLGSLAGAQFLPVFDPPTASAAENNARAIAEANYPALGSGGLVIEFGCVVTTPVSAGTVGCGPGKGTGTYGGGWIERGDKAFHVCDPYRGDLCNSIQLRASGTVQYWFAPILGFDSGNTDTVRATACRGNCGQVAAKLDVVFVIDRTGSMSAADIANVKDAIVDTSLTEDSVLEFYDPTSVWIGLVALPYQSPANPCAVDLRQDYPAQVPANQSKWQVVGLSNDYRQSNGPINASSTLVQRIQCLQRAPDNALSYPPSNGSGQHTNHGDPLAAAQELLTTTGRSDAENVIVFFADGQANQPTSTGHPCQYANDAATIAKLAGTAIFSLGYGVDDTKCRNDHTGPFTDRYGTYFLASTSGVTPDQGATDSSPGGCAPTENTDLDYYFCESRGEDLDAVFRQIASQTVQRSRLLNF